MPITEPPPLISIGAGGEELTDLRGNPRRKRASRLQGVSGFRTLMFVTYFGMSGPVSTRGPPPAGWGPASVVPSRHAVMCPFCRAASLF